MHPLAMFLAFVPGPKTLACTAEPLPVRRLPQSGHCQQGAKQVEACRCITICWMRLRIGLPSARVRPSASGFRSPRSTDVISQISWWPSSAITTTCSLRITAAPSDPAKVSGAGNLLLAGQIDQAGTSDRRSGDPALRGVRRDCPLLCDCRRSRETAVWRPPLARGPREAYPAGARPASPDNPEPPAHSSGGAARLPPVHTGTARFASQGRTRSSRRPAEGFHGVGLGWFRC